MIKVITFAVLASVKVRNLKANHNDYEAIHLVI